jgi:uncharacterized protein YgiM (DUF1202 family)
MKNSLNVYVLSLLALVLAGLACHLELTPPQQATPAINPVNPGNPTSQVQPQPPITFPETPTQTPTATNTIQPAPQKPTVLKTTLCWIGPGTEYEVVSSLKQGENVEVIGRGSIDGWLIIRNPTYHDPCWVQASDLQVDASLDVNALQIYNPPSKPTKTPRPTPEPTETLAA